MHSSKIVVFVYILVIFICFLADTGVFARPHHRMKRVSDHRLAELETLLALSKMKGQMMTVPVGYGRVDPDKIGRRRRGADNRTRDQTRKERLWHEIDTRK